MSGSHPIYHEISPPTELADVVECCWIQRGKFSPASAPSLARVLPDGCMDIIVTLGDFLQPLDDTAHSHRAFVVGTMTRRQIFVLEGSVDMIAVRFRPGGARPFLRVPAHELVDLGAPLEAFWGERGASLPERLFATVGDDARARLLFEELILRRTDAPTPDRVVQHASQLIDGSGGRITVDELRRALYVSERTLERRFKTEVGLSPKQAGRVARFRLALERMYRSPEAQLGRIAHECGYYDQAHFTREFTAMAGVSPSEWREEQARRSDS